MSIKMNIYFSWLHADSQLQDSLYVFLWTVENKDYVI